MRFYEDITVGDRSDLGSHTFEAEAIKAVRAQVRSAAVPCRRGSSQALAFRRLVASGWHTAAVCMRHNVDGKYRDDAALRAAGKPVAASGPSPGVRDIRWHKPIYPGDTITFISEITDKRDTSRPGYGLVTTSTTGTNQHGDVVYSVSGAVFVERREK